MKRFKVQAVFYVQAQDQDDAVDVAKDMVKDAVSEQYEHVDSVVCLEEVEQDEFHANLDDDEEED